jgi:N-acylneuraminate cytidylyltransferase
MKYQFLAVVPARAGSTRLKDKNLMTIGGKTLVRLAIECALDTGNMREIVVSSDSHKILEEADQFSAANPSVVLHHRSKKLATEHAKIEDLLKVLMDDRDWATHVVLLNPTSPFRDLSTVVRCVSAVTNLGMDSVATVYRSRQHHYVWRRNTRGRSGYKDWLPPFVNLRRGNRTGKRPRSQDLEEYELVEHGACYVASRECIDAGHLTGGVCMPIVTEKVEAIDIDDEYDLAMARGIWEHIGCPPIPTIPPDLLDL